MGVVALTLLPNRPDSPAGKGRFLTVEERRIAMARMNRGISGDRGLVVNRGASSTVHPVSESLVEVFTTTL